MKSIPLFPIEAWCLPLEQTTAADVPCCPDSEQFWVCSWLAAWPTAVRGVMSTCSVAAESWELRWPGRSAENNYYPRDFYG